MKVQIDNLGRIVIPKPLRKGLRINSYDFLTLELKNNTIIISKLVDVSYLDCFIEELKYNRDLNYQSGKRVKVDIDYIINRLEGLRNEQK